MFRAVLSVVLFVSTAPAGVIHGRVVDAKSGEPVKKAIVVIRHAQEAGLGAITDTSGEFQFKDLEPGAYTVTAEHSGFVIDPESRRSVINVSSEEKTEITVKLFRTAAISGRVVDEDGDPVTDASVQIVPAKDNNHLAASGYTNDRGEYRAWNITPGKYRIAVSLTPPEHGRRSEEHTSELQSRENLV